MVRASPADLDEHVLLQNRLSDLPMNVCRQYPQVTLTMTTATRLEQPRRFLEYSAAASLHAASVCSPLRMWREYAAYVPQGAVELRGMASPLSVGMGNTHRDRS